MVHDVPLGHVHAKSIGVQGLIVRTLTPALLAVQFTYDLPKAISRIRASICATFVAAVPRQARNRRGKVRRYPKIVPIWNWVACPL